MQCAPAGNEVGATTQPHERERDQACVTVQPDLHAKVEGGFRLDMVAPGADIGAAVGESLRGQCQIAIAKGGKQEIAEWVRKLGRRRSRGRDRHK